MRPNQALGETLTILTNDDARALFGKTISFFQSGASSAAREREQDHASKAAMQRLMDVGWPP